MVLGAEEMVWRVEGSDSPAVLLDQDGAHGSKLKSGKSVPSWGTFGP